MACRTAGAGGAAGSCLHNAMQLMQWTQTFGGHKGIYLNVIYHRFLSPNIWEKVEIDSSLWPSSSLRVCEKEAGDRKATQKIDSSWNQQ